MRGAVRCVRLWISVLDQAMSQITCAGRKQWPGALCAPQLDKNWTRSIRFRKAYRTRCVTSWRNSVRCRKRN